MVATYGPCFLRIFLAVHPWNVNTFLAGKKNYWHNKLYGKLDRIGLTRGRGTSGELLKFHDTEAVWITSTGSPRLLRFYKLFK